MDSDGMGPQQVVEMHAQLMREVIHGGSATALASASEREDDRRATLQDTSLTLLPLLLTSFSSHPSSQSYKTETRTQIVDLLILIGRYARPKEVILALGEGMEGLVAEVGECFLEEEDEEDAEDENDKAGAEGTQLRQIDGVFESDVKPRVKLDTLLDKLTVMLDVFAAAIHRFPTEKSLINALETLPPQLSRITQEIAFASQMGATHSPRSVWTVLSSLSRIVQSALYNNVARDTTSKGIALNQRISSPICNAIFETIITLRDTLRWGSLGRWYRANFPRDLIESLETYQNPRGAREGRDHEDEAELLSAVDGLIGSLGAVGQEYQSLLHSIRAKTHTLGTPAGPIASLHLAAYVLSESKSAYHNKIATARDPAAKFHVDGKQLSGKTSLRDSMPLLGSAWNGLGAHAAGVWTWECVLGMRIGAEHLEMETASMIIELIMPNLSAEPDPLARFALHKLLAGVIRLVEDPAQQIIEEVDPFQNVRIGALQLLRDFLVKDLSSEHIAFQAAFMNAFRVEIAPITFTLPGSDLPLAEMKLEEFVESPYLTWLTECLSLSFSLPRIVGNNESNYMAGPGDWVSDVEKVVTQMRRQAADVSVEVDLQLFALEEALSRAQANLGRTH